MGANDEIIEDSVIHQAHAHNMTIRMYGDDFWIGQYPASFDDYQVFPSLDITDLDSNDEIVRNRLLDQLENRTDWDILWTHVLGIDHAGHSFNNLGEGLQNKIKDVEELLTDIIDKLPEENTTLAILSDHGLTDIGNHGGFSNEERYTFIAFFQKDLPFQFSYKRGTNLQLVGQASICSTLSVLAGVEFPYSNVGSWIPDVITFPSHLSHKEKLEETIKLFVKNLLQIYNYLSDYLQIATLIESSTVEGIDTYLKIIEDQMRNLEDYFKNEHIHEYDVVRFYNVTEELLTNGTAETILLKQYLLPGMYQILFIL